MTMALHELVDTPRDEIESPDEFYPSLVQEMRETSEEIRTDEATPEDEEALAQAALWLVGSPIEADLDAVIAVGEASAVMNDERINGAFKDIIDAAYPIDDTIPNAHTLELNRQARERFELARATTDQNRSFGSAYIRASTIADKMIKISDAEADKVKTTIGPRERKVVDPATVEAIHHMIYEEPRARSIGSDGLYSSGELIDEPEPTPEPTKKPGLFRRR